MHPSYFIILKIHALAMIGKYLQKHGSAFKAMKYQGCIEMNIIILL